MNRSLAFTLVLLSAGANLGAATPAPVAVRAVSPSPFQELFDLSLKEKKGLQFHLSGGQILGGMVTKVGETTVEVKNREYGRILIRLDRIDAVAMN